MYYNIWKEDTKKSIIIYVKKMLKILFYYSSYFVSKN